MTGFFIGSNEFQITSKSFGEVSANRVFETQLRQFSLLVTWGNAKGLWCVKCRGCCKTVQAQRNGMEMSWVIEFRTKIGTCHMVVKNGYVRHCKPKEWLSQRQMWNNIERIEANFIIWRKYLLPKERLKKIGFASKMLLVLNALSYSVLGFMGCRIRWIDYCSQIIGFIGLQNFCLWTWLICSCFLFTHPPPWENKLWEWSHNSFQIL